MIQVVNVPGSNLNLRKPQKSPEDYDSYDVRSFLFSFHSSVNFYLTLQSFFLYRLWREVDYRMRRKPTFTGCRMERRVPDLPQSPRILDGWMESRLVEFWLFTLHLKCINFNASSFQIKPGTCVPYRGEACHHLLAGKHVMITSENREDMYDIGKRNCR